MAHYVLTRLGFESAMHVSPLVTDKQTDIAALYRLACVRSLDLFGSAVHEDFDPKRGDLDFVVEFDELPREAYADAFFPLKKGLERLFARQADLLTDRAIRNPYFRQRLAAERERVYVA